MDGSETVMTLFVYILHRVFFRNVGRKCIISEERFVLELPTSRAMLATARPSCSYSELQMCGAIVAFGA